MRFPKWLAFRDEKLPSARQLFSSSVHPTDGAAHGQDRPGADARLTKLVDLLGAQGESEFLQVLALLNNCQKQQRQDSEEFATPGVGSSWGDGEDEAEQEDEEEEEEEEKQTDIATKFGSSHSHLPASRYSQDQTSTNASPSRAGAMPASPRRTSALEHRSSGSCQSATNRSRHSPASEDASPTPVSPERHYLPSPQLSSVKDLSPTCHPLPAPPPSQSTKNTVSAASRKHRSTSLRNSAAMQLPLPSASARVGLTRFSDRVLHRGGNDTTRELDVVCQQPSWTTGPPLCKSLSQAVQQAVMTERLRSTDSTAAGLECPSPPLSTPRHSPPGTPSRVYELYPLNEPPIPAKTPCKSTPSSTTPLPPQLRTHVQPSCNQSPPCTPPLSPVHYNGSPSRPSWSQVPRCPRKWTKGAKLGQGTFGIVYEGWNQEDGSFFAVKVSSVEDSSPEIQREVEVLSRLEHPNIVRYLGSSVEDGHLCIFLELVRMGSLESIMKKYRRFKDNTIRTYTRQILHGLEYLHDKKTIHRDIKCANILVDVNGQVKLADFGVAKLVEQSLASSIKGTPLYMAPEVLTAHGNNYSFPADIWSLGCTVLEMAAGKPPWSDLHGFGFFFKVKNGELPSIPEHTSPEGKDFILRCLRFEPQDRPTAKELLQHPFVANVLTPEDVISWPLFSSPPPSPSPWASSTWHPSLVQGRPL